ncbi:UdgX family uracil-DNA binding protein [Kribbella sp. NPDC004875]|uniref:UdgX family uracil-DNA binding protein n=1 Tax=Kribbella sp. NPDC004875 TaxID=3364107 RepID=UPI0036958925
MNDYAGAEKWVPHDGGMRKVRAVLGDCRGCDLWEDAEQAVAGEGPVRARMMLVGETPGDHEDKEGHVFVGPAGHLLDKALVAAGIERSEIYLTNAVKHFRFEREGKRRIHKTPSAGQIVACAPWLRRELEIVKPELVVVMGAVAARTLLGPSFRVTQHRGERVELADGRAAVATVHPSAVVRSQEFRRDFDRFVKDLRGAAALLD